MAVLTFAGPWSAYGVSLASQRGRLAGLLEQHGMLVGGRVTPATAPVPVEDRRQMSAALRYLAGTHGLETIAPWFSDSLARAADLAGAPSPRYQTDDRSRRVMTALGMTYAGPYIGSMGERFSYTAESAAALPVADFDSLVRISEWGRAQQRPGLWVRLRERGNRLDVLLGPERLAAVPLDSALARARRAAGQSAGQLPRDVLRVEASGPRADIVVFLSSVTGEIIDGTPRVQRVSADVLVRLR